MDNLSKKWPIVVCAGSPARRPHRLFFITLRNRTNGSDEEINGVRLSNDLREYHVEEKDGTLHAWGTCKTCTKYWSMRVPSGFVDSVFQHLTAHNAQTPRQRFERLLFWWLLKGGSAAMTKSAHVSFQANVLPAYVMDAMRANWQPD